MEKREDSEAYRAGKCATGSMAKHQTPPKAPPVLARRARKNPTGKGWVFELVVRSLLPNYSLLVPMSNAAEDSTCAMNLCDMIHTVPDGEKFGAAPFISAIISSASGYFSAMRGEMTMP